MKHLLVGDFLERVLRGETVTGISEALGLHRKTLQRRLRKLGYTWDGEKLRWRWTGKEGQEPLHVSLIDMNLSWSEQLIHTGSQAVNEGGTNIVSSPFTLDEIKGLKEMLIQWKQQADSTVALSEKDLVERIQEIKNMENEKVRKTIVIDEGIGLRFDEYAEKTRLNKSDLLHLAIHELMERYPLP